MAFTRSYISNLQVGSGYEIGSIFGIPNYFGQPNVLKNDSRGNMFADYCIPIMAIAIA